MDPVTIMAITSIVTVGCGAIAKILYSLRHNIKQCGSIVFRSTSTSRNSPRLTEINNIRNHLEQTLPVQVVTPSIKANDDTVRELENKIKIKELENKLKELEGDCERVYI